MNRKHDYPLHVSLANPFTRANSTLLTLIAWMMLLLASATDIAADTVNWEFEYDQQGFLTQAVDPAKERVEYHRDFHANGSLSRVATVPPSGDPVVREFDDQGQLTAMSDSLGNSVFERDGLGRITSMHRAGAPAIRYSYDSDDRLSAYEVGDAWRIDYKYDYLGRLRVMSTPVGQIRYAYNPKDGEASRTYPNGIVATYHTDENGALEFIRYTDSDRQLLLKFEFTYRADGLINRLVEWKPSNPPRRIDFEYDTSLRLTVVTDSVHGRSEYVYDKFGNRTVSTRAGRSTHATYDWADRLIEYAGAVVHHDRAENITNLAEMSVAYVNGSVASVNASGLNVTYHYDGNGLIAERLANSRTTKIVTDPMATGWNPLLVEEPGGSTYYLWEDDLLLATVRDGVATFHLHDHLGSIRADTKPNGLITAEYNYSAFGEPDTAVESRFPFVGFAGMSYDALAQVYITPGRPYNPSLGRFLQPDPELRTPFGAQQDFSRYAYCANDPVNFLDREGLSKEPFAQTMDAWIDDATAFLKKKRERTYLLYRLETPDGKLLKYGHTTVLDRYTAVNKGDVVMHIIDAGPRDVILGKERDLIRTRPGPFNLESFVPEAKRNANDAKRVKYLRDPKLNQVVKKKLRNEQLKLSQQRLETNRQQLRHRQRQHKQRDHRWRTDDFRRRSDFTRHPHIRRTRPSSLISETRASAVGNVIPTLLDGHMMAMDYLSDPNAFGDTGLTTEVPRIIRNESGKLSGLRHSGTTHGKVAGTLDSPGGKVSVRQADLVWLKSSPAQTIRTDNLTVTGTGYRYERKQTIETPKPKGFLEGLIRGGASVWQMFNPLADYGTSDRVTTTTHVQSRQRVTTHGGVQKIINQPFDSQQADDVSAVGGIADSTLFGGNTPLTAQSTTGPSHNVGGIYLGGAEADLGIGVATGAYVDPISGALVLLSPRDEVELPPMRLDDVVTVFRAVYDHDSAPWVSIDPKPEAPEGPLMDIRHGPGTANTFVGWVLFEADRVMKAYKLGKDTLTDSDITTGIAGYDDVLDAGMFEPSRDDLWERFWIVPAKASRASNPDRTFSQLEVPLTVNTEVMIMDDGVLVPAAIVHADGSQEKAPPSLNASAFTTWFAENMSKVGSEWRSKPPAGSDIDGDVDVFFELHRIALLSAIAEKLRDDGVAMPAWMREYAVRRVEFGTETPALVVHRESSRPHPDQPGVTQIAVSRIYGGATMSAPADSIDDAVDSMLTETIVEPLQRATVGAELLKTVEFDSGEASYTAVVLPGVDTKDVGGLSLVEPDLFVPVHRGTDIALQRYHHSFHRTFGEFGRGWTLDLPELRYWLKPIATHDQSRQYEPVYELYRPLRGSWAVFSKRDNVPGLGTNLFVPSARSDVIALVPSKDPMVVLRDGRRLTFTEQGLLKEVNSGLSTIVYSRDDDGTLQRIESQFRGEIEASIDLNYTDGQVTSAWGSNGAVATYAYTPSGRLETANNDGGVVAYKYRGDLLHRISRNGETPLNYEYNNRGQLMRIWDGTALVKYERQTDAEGRKVVVATMCAGAQLCESDTTESRTVYGHDMHIIESVDPHGVQRRTQQAPDGTRVTTIEYPSGEQTRVVAPADGSWTELTYPSGETFRLAANEAGRLTQVDVDGETLFEQRWHPNGQLASREYRDHVIRPEYAADGTPRGLLIAAPTRDNRHHEWTHTSLDDHGRPSFVKDSSGRTLRYGWGNPDDFEKGHLARVESNSGGRVDIGRDDFGRVTSIETSWGSTREFDYTGPEQRLSRILLHNGVDTAEIIFNNDRVEKVRQYDGGERSFSYEDDRLRQIVTPAGVVLSYAYNGSGRISSVSIDDTYKVDYRYDSTGRLVGISRRKND